MGDPAGIGGELTLRAWQALHRDGPRFVALDDPRRLAQLSTDVPIAEIATAEAANDVFATALPVLPLRLAVAAHPGRPDKANARAVIASIERAAALCVNGAAGGMVTDPINKAALYDAGFAYPGHTEFLAELTGARGKQIMMLGQPGIARRARHGACLAARLDRHAQHRRDHCRRTHHGRRAAARLRNCTATSCRRRAEPARR